MQLRRLLLHHNLLKLPKLPLLVLHPPRPFRPALLLSLRLRQLLLPQPRQRKKSR